MSVIQNPLLPRSALPGIEHVTLAGSNDGLRQLSIWRQSVAPGGATPPHRHDCEEVVVIEAGTGELHIGGEIHCFESDTTLIVPRNAVHQIVNTGAIPLKLLAVFGMSPVAVFLADGEPLVLPWPS